MRRLRRQAVLGGLLATGMILGLVGCSAGPLIDKVPEAVGGLPPGAPARPVTPYQYPAVHDMPPPRDSQPLSEEDQVKLEKELQAVRDRQAAQGSDGPANQNASAPAKKRTPAKNSQKTGADTGAKANP